MRYDILINAAPGETRLALLEDGRLAEFVNSRLGNASRVGGIYLGRVVEVSKPLKGVFVDFGDARPGLLGGTDVPDGVRLIEGDMINVRVLRDATDDKGAKLSAHGAAYPAPPPDPIETFLKARAGDDWRIVVDDPVLAARLRKSTGRTIDIHADRIPLFESHDAEDALEAALEPDVPLPGGGSIVIEETAALTAIDVNTGNRDFFATNLEAAQAAADALRLRNIGGQAVIDFLPMKRHDQRAQVIDRLRQAVKADFAKVHVIGLTRLGLCELTRRRIGESLATRMGLSRMRTRSAETRVLELLRRIDEQARASGARRMTFALAPDVRALLDSRYAPTLDALTKRHALELTLT
jgi:Ribonuclease G/E